MALAATAAFGPWQARAETMIGPEKALPSSNQADFDQVWELVRDRFYDPRFNGLDWQEQRQPPLSAPRRRLRELPRELAAVINTMLAKLGASHTHFYKCGRSSLLSAYGYFPWALWSVAALIGCSQRGTYPLPGRRRVHRGGRSGPHLRNQGDRGDARPIMPGSCWATRSCRRTAVRSAQ